MEIPNIKLRKGVHASDLTLVKFSNFETHYITVRTKEKRVLSISEIQNLPYAYPENAHYAEWKLRQKNIERLLDYLQEKKPALRILDIGCGNGFMTHLMAGNTNEAVGVDVNFTELKQAAVAFPNHNLKWYYLDIVNEVLPEKPFDIITFGASFQYFKDIEKLLKVCKKMLTEKGEIHIIDSPFYSPESKLKAKENSGRYFKNMGVDEMAAYYNHHSFDVFKDYVIEMKYNPDSFFRKIFKRSDSPFPWIKIV